MEFSPEIEKALPPTRTRVEASTAAEVNEKIMRATRSRLRGYRAAQPAAISRRLAELDREWDIERTLEANAATLALLGLGLGAFVDRKWFLLPAAVAAFLLQHALQGWCPPVPVFRRLQVRTAAEIEAERTALRILRGDFPGTNDPETALRQAKAKS